MGVRRRPPHPGTAIKQWLKSVKPEVNQETLAEALRTSRFTINSIINGRRSVTPDMALKLAYVFGSPPESWLTLQMNYDIWEAEQNFSNEGLTKLRQNTKPLRGGDTPIIHADDKSY